MNKEYFVNLKVKYFVDKNRDLLRPDVIEMFINSRNQVNFKKINFFKIFILKCLFKIKSYCLKCSKTCETILKIKEVCPKQADLSQ